MSSSAVNVTVASGSTPYVPLADNLYYEPLIVLTNQSHWAEFHAHANEMMLNKRGRELFPKLEIGFENLEKDGLYCVSVSLFRPNGNKYVYKNGRWAVKEEEQEEEVSTGTYTNEVVFVPMLGNELAKGALKKKMEAVKIFNVGARGEERTMAVEEQMMDQILVESQCKYAPVITLKKLNEATMRFEFHAEACFLETEFVTVTGYKNPNIRALKSRNKYRAQNHPNRRAPGSVTSSTGASTPEDSPPPALHELEELEVETLEEEDDFFDYFPDLRQ